MEELNNSNNNSLLQQEELEVLQSIYNQDFSECIDQNTEQFYFEIRIVPDKLEQLVIYFQFTFHEFYPSDRNIGFHFQLNQNNLVTGNLVGRVKSELNQLFIPGTTCIFQMCEYLKENFHLWIDIKQEDKTQKLKEIVTLKPPNISPLNIYSSKQAISEKKSKFVAHACKVRTIQEVHQMLNQLKQDKKIANATHNIIAYRIVDSSGTLLEDRDDDGEVGAAENLLFILQKHKVENVVIVVTRWFGGIMLGSLRFRLINLAAEELLKELGWI